MYQLEQTITMTDCSQRAMTLCIATSVKLHTDDMIRLAYNVIQPAHDHCIVSFKENLIKNTSIFFTHPGHHKINCPRCKANDIKGWQPERHNLNCSPTPNPCTNNLLKSPGYRMGTQQVLNWWHDNQWCNSYGLWGGGTLDTQAKGHPGPKPRIPFYTLIPGLHR